MRDRVKPEDFPHGKRLPDVLERPSGVPLETGRDPAGPVSGGTGVFRPCRRIFDRHSGFLQDFQCQLRAGHAGHVFGNTALKRKGDTRGDHHGQEIIQLHQTDVAAKTNASPRLSMASFRYFLSYARILWQPLLCRLNQSHRAEYRSADLPAAAFCFPMADMKRPAGNNNACVLTAIYGRNFSQNAFKLFACRFRRQRKTP